MELINLTPHSITIFDNSNNTVVVPPSGKVARVSATPVEVYRVGNIPCFSVSYGEVEGLPEPSEGTIYIVSALVRSAVPHRKDLASPGELVRDDAGKPIGCRGLAVNYLLPNQAQPRRRLTCLSTGAAGFVQPESTTGPCRSR